ncbi:MAG: hypothetical protein MUC38_05355 [Cyclobacteriaceae bacterium]|nr:hypothetical protein [Cyclobacteriaceae bacterium]
MLSACFLDAPGDGRSVVGRYLEFFDTIGVGSKDTVFLIRALRGNLLADNFVSISLSLTAPKITYISTLGADSENQFDTLAFIPENKR